MLYPAKAAYLGGSHPLLGNVKVVAPTIFLNQFDAAMPVTVFNIEIPI